MDKGSKEDRNREVPCLRAKNLRKSTTFTICYLLVPLNQGIFRLHLRTCIRALFLSSKIPRCLSTRKRTRQYVLYDGVTRLRLLCALRHVVKGDTSFCILW
jgi:hypothetical protein